MSLKSSLVAYWSMDEAAGARVDATLRGNDLSDPATVASTAGLIGNGISLVRASSKYLLRASTADLVTGDIDFTLQAWVKLASKPAEIGHIVAKSNWPATGREYFIRWENGTDRFWFRVSPDGAAEDGVAANILGAPAIGTWYHIVAWHDSVANTININVNDTGTDSAAHATGVFAGTSDLVFGTQYQHTSEFIDGVVDESGLWKRVLTAAERTRLYRGGAGLSYASMGGHKMRPQAGVW